MIKNTVSKLTPLALLLLFLLCVGCTGDNTEEENLPAPSPTPTAVETEAPPQTGGRLNLAMRSPKTLNPLLNEDVSVDAVLKLMYEPIFAYDRRQQPVPNLASASFASDGMSVMLTIREGAFWSDGEPVVADDIIFSLDTLRNAADTVIYKSTVRNISNFTSIDDRTVRINYIQPFMGSSYLLCFPIIPQHYYLGEVDPQSEKNMSPVGNGLYRFDSYTNMKEMTLSINSNCYRRQPYIENVHVMISPDIESDLYALDQSLVDMVSADIADWSKYRSAKDTNITEYVTSYYDFIGFNFQNSRFQDKKIRAAIAHSINIDEMVESIYMNHAVRSNTPVNPSSWVCESDVEQYEYDLEQTKTLLKQAGYTLSNNNRFEEEINGEKVPLTMRILVNQENTERVKIAEALKENLETAGVQIELDKQPFSEYEKKLKSRDYEMFIGGFHLSVIPDLTFAFHSSQIDLGSNYFGYSDETTDSLLGQAFTSTGEIQIVKSLSDLQKRIASELPCISLVFRKTAVLSDARIGGEIKPVYSNIFSNVNELYCKEKEPKNEEAKGSAVEGGQLD